MPDGSGPDGRGPDGTGPGGAAWAGAGTALSAPAASREPSSARLQRLGLMCLLWRMRLRPVSAGGTVRVRPEVQLVPDFLLVREPE
ncbi:hypothetical protein F7P10_17885 [Actinomadura sp. WMMB 499]|nr:hypothetical protein F7P10_17885 [Actinomadura sp. WMMB 499]